MPEGLGDLLKVKVLRLNEDLSLWRAAGEMKSVDAVNKTVTCLVGSFSIFRIGYARVASDLKKAIAGPNPVSFKTSPYFYFRKLTENPTIKIYTVSGELVRTLAPGPNNRDNTGQEGSARWDGKNEAGELVSRGIYVYIITNAKGSDPARGRLIAE